MTSKEIMKQVLEKWQFPILEETETAILFRYKLHYVQVGSLDEEVHSVAVTLSRFFHADDEREERIALSVCNDLNYRMMAIKMYVTESKDLVVSSEFYYKDEYDAEYLLDMSLQSVMYGKKTFIKHYLAAEEEEKLFEELDSDADNGQ